MPHEALFGIIIGIAIFGASFSLGWFMSCIYSKGEVVKENDELKEKIVKLEEKLAKRTAPRQRRKKNEAGNRQL